jgi:hypothetical protein
MSRALPFAVLLLAMGSSAPAQSPAPKTPAPTLTDAEMEHFLLEGQIIKHKYAGKGVTSTQRVTLRLGDMEHDCHVTTIDEHKTSMQLASGMELDFHDSYTGYVAAYRLDRLLGINMVPVTVVRLYNQKQAAFTWWMDDIMFDESQRVAKKVHPPDVTIWNHRMYVVRVFDQLIYNFDRNLTNLLIDKSWRMWMIDHGRAFKVFSELRSPKELDQYCDRRLLAALRALDRGAVTAALHDVLSPGQINGLMARRDLIVKYYDDKIAALGEDAVLYDLPPQITVPTTAPLPTTAP